jgi:glycosyltransferase involved in cell wall biosynthesis
VKLLICTQKIDLKDDNLGFFHAWVVEFAKHCEQVTVIALFVGDHKLPPNVRVLSLGKERGVSRIKYLFNFYRFIVRERASYDAVFVHMNTEYVVLGAPFWKLMGKKIGLWYTHKQVGVLLRIAARLSDVIFTASRESFRLTSEKVRVLGHGIDTTFFSPGEQKIDEGIFRIVSVGRISPVKSYETLIDAVALLDVSPSSIEVIIVGGPGTSRQEVYLRELEARARRSKFSDRIFFVGAVPNRETLPYLRGADVFVNMSKTGSLDKAVLEAMATGMPVLTSNEGLKTVLSHFQEKCMFAEGDKSALALQLRALLSMPKDERRRLGRELRSIVEQSHNLNLLIPHLLKAYS